jgi:hypothetical protein
MFMKQIVNEGNRKLFIIITLIYGMKTTHIVENFALAFN